MTADEFWQSIRRSAALIRGHPAWESGGIVLSDNFEGERGMISRCRLCHGMMAPTNHKCSARRFTVIGAIYLPDGTPWAYCLIDRSNYGSTEIPGTRIPADASPAELAEWLRSAAKRVENEE